MDFLTLDRSAQAEVFEQAGRILNRSASILEKDFWVVWTLEALFETRLASALAFKGGTSLSKVYNVIHRFSEDIDITVDKHRLGYPEEVPGEKLSGEKRKKQLEAATRHYYDVAQLAIHEIGRQALANRDLLETVREDKIKFFRSAWSNFEAAKPGSLRLVPHNELETLLRDDYHQMVESGMFYREPPPWTAILTQLEELETEINT